MRRLAWTQERVLLGDFAVRHCPQGHMPADIGTKVPKSPLDFDKFVEWLYLP